MRKIVASLMDWDQKFVLDLVPQRSEKLNRFMTLATLLGDGWLWLAIGLFALIVDTNADRLLFQLALGTGLQLFLYLLVKQVCSRRRPFELLENVPCIRRPSDRYSFPSGHTAAAFVVVATVGLFYSFLFLPLLLLALLIGFSRIYLGVHYPTDILAGALLGIFCAEIARWLVP